MSSLRLTAQLQQRMVLTPQLRQRIEMLQMNSLELNDLIEVELVANPILEEVQPGDEVQEIGNNILDQNSDGQDHGLENGVQGLNGDSGSDFESVQADGVGLNGNEEKAANDFESDGVDEVGGEGSDAFDEIDYGREFQDYLDPGYRTQEIEYKDDAPSFEQFLTHSPNLSEHLEWQLNLLSLNDALEEAASMIIGNLDEDGRLATELEEIAEMAGCSLVASAPTPSSAAIFSSVARVDALAGTYQVPAACVRPLAASVISTPFSRASRVRSRMLSLPGPGSIWNSTNCPSE